jgi:hypothetical protein
MIDEPVSQSSQTGIGPCGEFQIRSASALALCRVDGALMANHNDPRGERYISFPEPYYAMHSKSDDLVDEGKSGA